MTEASAKIEAAFIAGFRASSEGWNGEWPFAGIPDHDADFEPIVKNARAYAAHVEATTPNAGERG
jgi:hypothetical protein